MVVLVPPKAQSGALVQNGSMTSHQHVNLTYGELLDLDREAGMDTVTWRWIAEQVLLRLESEGAAAYWYERGGRVRGVVPGVSEDGWGEVFFSAPGVSLTRRNDPGPVVVSGVREPRSILVNALADALENVCVPHMVPRASVLGLSL